MRAPRLVAASLVVGLTLAVVPASATMAADPDFTPSGSKWRAYVINVLGSVLGGALPNSWKAEQIANQHRYNYSWDQFSAQFGYSANTRDANGNLRPIPKAGVGTYDDYVVAEYEKQFKQGGSGNKPMAAPATKPLGFAKVAGGALSAFMAFEVGTYLGSGAVNLAGGWFGFDPQGVVCGQTADGSILSAATRYVSNQDCSMFDLSAEYLPNGDAGTTYGDLVLNGYSFKYLGTYTPAGYTNWGIACAKITSTLPAGYGLYGKDFNGVTRGFGPGAAGQGSDSALCPPTRTHYYTVYKPGGHQTQILAAPVWIAKTVTPNTPEATMAVTKEDPDRQLECKSTYTDGSFLSALGPVYKESTGSVSPPVCPPTPEGKIPEKVEVLDNQLGGRPTTEVAEMPVTEEYQEWMEAYPECVGGACKLDLKKKGGAPVSCFDLEEGCLGWFEAPNKADLYQCTYGAHDVPLDECNVYSGLFQPQRVEIGSPYSDPLTGSWSGGQTAPKSGTTAMTQTVQDPASLRSCNFDGLGFDPVGWVLRPVQCALEWAFVPRPVVVELQFAQAGDVWQTKPPAVIAEAVTALTPTATGCSRDASLFSVDFAVLDTCSGVMAELAMWSRWITSAGMVLLVLVVLRRQIAAMVGYNQGQG